MARPFRSLLPALPENHHSRFLLFIRGFDPRDEDNFFTGMVAFVALYNEAMNVAEMTMVYTELSTYRSTFNIEGSSAATPSVTVSNSSDFASAVSNAAVVNFTFSSADTFDSQTWYVYRPDKDVLIDGSATTQSFHRRLHQSSSDPSTWPLISAPANQRVMRIDAGNVTIRNMRFRGNGTVPSIDSTGGQGGCLLFGTTGTITFENVQFEQCVAVGSGGAVNANSKITIINGVFINSSSLASGGALFASDLLTLSGSTFINSSSGSGVIGFGGAVFAAMNATVTDCSFSASSAATGGAIYAAANLAVSSSSFAASTARGTGGAIYASPTSSLTIADSTFTGSAATSSGGSVAATDFVQITGSNFTGSSSGSLGGAVYVGQNVTIQGCSFAFCTARQSGGAVYALDGASVSNSLVSYSSATVSGGGVFAGINLAVASSTFRGTTAGITGGALFASDNLVISGSVFANVTSLQVRASLISS